MFDFQPYAAVMGSQLAKYIREQFTSGSAMNNWLIANGHKNNLVVDNDLERYALTTVDGSTYKICWNGTVQRLPVGPGKSAVIDN